MLFGRSPGYCSHCLLRTVPSNYTVYWGQLSKHGSSCEYVFYTLPMCKHSPFLSTCCSLTTLISNNTAAACNQDLLLGLQFLPDPRGAGLHLGFQFSYVCSFVRTFVRTFVRSFVRSFVHSFVRSFVRLLRSKFSHYTFIKPWIPKISTDSRPPIKLDGVGPVDNRPPTD